MNIINKLKLLPYAMMALLVLNGCKDDEKDEKGSLTLDFKNLPKLGDKFVYEGWLVVDGKPLSAGRFSADGKADFKKTFSDVKKADLDKATAYILTIEPEPDTDPNPSKTHILAGAFADNSAALTIGDASAVGSSFTAAAGTYILSTPTNGVDDPRQPQQLTDPKSGVWWLVPDADIENITSSLTLPTLTEGWKYEGWAVIDSKPVSTGKFTSGTGIDEANTFSSAGFAPPFPGEDFLTHAPDGLTFPVDLAAKQAKIVISVEPDPDDGSAPFALKPLVGQVPTDAQPGASQTMANTAAATVTNITGTAKR